MKHKTLIIIGAGIEACEGIKIAKEMDLQLIIVDGKADAPGMVMADISIVLSTYAGDAIAEAAVNLVRSGIVIDGVIAMCADVPLSVAKVANALGLPGLSIETATLVADKLLMKERLQQKGIPIPQFRQVYSSADLKEVESDFGVPFVIKPVDSRGARGVLLLDKPEQYEQAYLLAKAESPTGRVMVEEYLVGPQISTETLVDNKTCFTFGFSDRNYEWLEKTKPYIIENGGDTPSSLSQNAKADVISTVEKAALALGIHSGVAKGDMVFTSSGAKVIEVAGRLSGGYFSTTQIPLATGVNFVKQAILLALGETLNKNELINPQCNGVAIRYLSLKPGVIKSIDGLEEAKQMPGVEMLKFFLKAGDEILSLSNHTQRSGFVIARADDKKQAVEQAYTALNKIRVTYE